ncbi:MAG: MFS transporter [Nitriliruptoraceae bacterium]|nr:MFS transporter [Nitriliruptoraceae bacterium]
MRSRDQVQERAGGEQALPATPSATTPPARSSWQLLADPTFGPFFLGKLLSTVGIWIYNIVAAILAFELSGSAFVVGLVSVAQFGPQLLFAPLSGAMADRGDRRRQLILGRVIAASGAGGLSIALWVLGVDGLPGAWPVVLAAFVVGVGFVIGGPAMNALIPALVPRHELATAIAVNSIPFTVARAGGPAIGALIAATTGPALAFAIAAAANLVFAAVLIPLDITTRAPRSGGDRRVRAGVAYLRVDRGITPLLIGVAVVGIGADPVITLTPSLAASLGGGSTLVGTFASAFGIGAGALFVVLTRVRNWLGLERLAVVGLGMLAGGLALAAASPYVPLTVAGFVLGGAGMTASITSLSTQLQVRLPEELRGRVMALWSVSFLGSRPFAAAFNGSLSDATTPGIAMAVVAVIVLAGAWWCRPTRMAARPAPADLDRG